MAAVLFGISTPLAKILVPGLHPLVLGGWIYLGMGTFMVILWVFSRSGKRRREEARLRRGDIPWLGCTVLAGGVLAPVLLLTGLSDTPASTAALLLNFEAVATTLIAFGVFREHVGTRVAGAVIVITAATVLLSVNLSGTFGLSVGALAVVASCAFWGLDNNCTRVVSLRDPTAIGSVKGICAAIISLTVAFVLKAASPDIHLIAGAFLLGFTCFGISSYCFILSLRNLGAARTGAYFGAAPFIGVLASFFVFRELPNLQFLAALPLMAAGAWLLVSEVHVHLHTHEYMEHEHRHRHDDGHHLHDHGPAFEKEHTHLHVHEEMEHSHPHAPDIHHRH
ncbi:MAG: DMT family transporter [Methanolinea sp.]|nr:DMT family transporter [Methanolinea sp.]